MEVDDCSSSISNNFLYRFQLSVIENMIVILSLYFVSILIFIAYDKFVLLALLIGFVICKDTVNKKKPACFKKGTLKQTSSHTGG